MGAITAATAIGGVTALTGLGLSISQNLKSKSAMREAEKAQQNAINELKKLEFHDEFAELQVPILGSELAFQQQQQALKTGIEALQEQGATGALGGVTKLEQARSKQALQTAARLEEEEMRLDLIRQKNEQDIANRNLGLQANILGQEIEGAGLAARDASEQQQMSQQGMYGSLGMLAGVAQEAQALYPGAAGDDQGVKKVRESQGMPVAPPQYTISPQQQVTPQQSLIAPTLSTASLGAPVTGLQPLSYDPWAMTYNQYKPQR
jgi:hypothetical protein|tara:strand:+ start:22685 stop:23476 length:792 start_codon:yes stop_codon:yes gene_type:complete